MICLARRQLWLSSPIVVIDEGELLARSVTCGGSLIRSRLDSCRLHHLVANIPRIEGLRFGGWTAALWPSLKLLNLAGLVFIEAFRGATCQATDLLDIQRAPLCLILRCSSLSHFDVTSIDMGHICGRLRGTSDAYATCAKASETRPLFLRCALSRLRDLTCGKELLLFNDLGVWLGWRVL